MYNSIFLCVMFVFEKMQQRQIYTSFDSRWKQVVSKDDIVQAFLDVGIDVEFDRIEWMEKRNSNATKWRYCPNSIKWNRFCSWCKLYQYSNSRKEKYIHGVFNKNLVKQDQPVPIEVNDFVTFINDVYFMYYNV